MRKAALIVCAALFVSSAVFAQAPSQAPLSQEALTAILGAPAVSNNCGGAQQAEMVFAAKRPELPEKASCSATCLGGGSVSCSGTTCSAKNGACGSTGSVTCNGTAHFCPSLSFCSTCNICGDCYSCCRCAGQSGSFCSANC